MSEINAREAKGKKGKMVIQPDAGLGNRLYCLYSAYYYADRCGRDFDILWLRENCCNVPFDALFDLHAFRKKHRIKTIYHLGYKNKYIIHTILSNCYMNYVRKSRKYITAEKTREIFDNEGEQGFDGLFKEDNIVIKANGIFIKPQNFASVREYIKPSNEIQSMVDEIMAEGNTPAGPTIGIHIRRTDNKRSIENSPISAFEQICEQLTKENPATRFYIATDDETVLNDFSNKYNVIKAKRFGKVKARDSVEGMKDAYVDMLCLSRCDKIYGSFASSFSEVAALIGDIKLEVVTIQ